jgi:protein-tyrosine phosphatase
MKILFVCLGNICRSPLAEGILNSISPMTYVDSAGTSNYHIGQSPDQRMQSTAKSYGIDLSKLKARQIKKSDFEKFDRIYVMDSSNYKDVVTLANNDQERQKVFYTLKNNENVPDPYFGGQQGFEEVYHLLLEACQEIKSQNQKR